MKKISLILVLALVLVGAFAAVALADQSHPTTDGVYLPQDPNALLASGYSPIHSSYTNNTDACASCHSVHNAKESEFLLQWASPSEACLACHDGTVTATYDVVAGKVSDTTALTAGGNFAVHAGSGSSASEHGVFGGTLLYTAPGGKGSADLGGAAAAGADKYGEWKVDEAFTCDSCHEPHGAGGNFRLLNPNPNLVMSQGQSGSTVFGLKGVQLGTTTFTDLTGTTKFYFKDGKTTATTTDGLGAVVTSVTNKTRPFLKDYSVNVYVGGVLVPSPNYVIGIEAVAGVQQAYVNFIADAGDGLVTVDYTPVLQVNAAVSNKLTATEKIVYGAGMTEFCLACHTDYAGSRSSGVAVYDTTNKYHHSGNRANSSGSATFPQLGNYTGVVSGTGASTGSCLTCHFAHGVDQARWATVATTTGISEYNSPELAGSSALKRLPNMGTCEVCHKQQIRSYSPGNKFVLKTIPQDTTKSAWQF